MCYFVLIGVPAASEPGFVEGMMPRGMATRACTNRSLSRRLPKGYQTYAIVSGMCSCDFFISAASRYTKTSDPDVIRRRYEKKGWSQGRIERAVRQASAKPEKPAPFLGLRADLREVLAVIGERAGGIALVVHWFDGEFEKEAIPLRETQQATTGSLQSGRLAVEEDILYLIAIRRRTTEP